MQKVKDLFERSGMTLDALGQAMGYAPEMARKSAWQFLKKTDDPRISMLRRFAKAMKVPLEDLIAESKKKNGK